MLGSYVFAVPSATSPQVIQKLNQVLVDVAKDTSVKNRMVQLTIDPILSSPEEARVYVQKLNERFAVLIKEANFVPN
jgi:tripartite-type tricarboxylate transporter receptor subunit TctC